MDARRFGAVADCRLQIADCGLYISGHVNHDHGYMGRTEDASHVTGFLAN